MSIKLVMFDLDGTLLPMDQDLFIDTYFGMLIGDIAVHGYDPKELADTIWRGTVAMIRNGGRMSNEQRFWEVFDQSFPGKRERDTILFERFYETKFDEVCKVFGFDSRSATVVKLLKDNGIRVALATNPVFPRIATEKRAAHAGLDLSDFELVTTYENSTSAKPSLSYYEEILLKLSLRAEDCLMVGNDVDDDMVAEKLGMRVFLLTDCLINKGGADISAYPHGDFDELIEYIKSECL